jgi:hypothetical protein
MADAAIGTRRRESSVAETAAEPEATLLETKLHAPKPRRGHVPRPRLLERLNRGSESKLTLVAAPTGFGKTTLLADWVAQRAVENAPTGWLRLDAADNDPASFWTYLIAVLRTVAPGAGGTALTLLHGRQTPLRAVLTSLVNELASLPRDVVLILDDAHAVDDQETLDALVFLLEHMPPQVHVVIATQVDPAAVRDATVVIGPAMASLNALMFGTLLYRSRLVPRAIPALGLVGSPLLIAFVIGTMLGVTGPGSLWQAVAVFPFFFWELAVGLWMTFKGFNRSAPIVVAMAAEAGATNSLATPASGSIVPAADAAGA